ncbi:MAG: HAD family phosphatase [Candidatus Omnitrophica bacterium]|nr:HAD family phosphatase [Candidatus Omnitrophota bacterium]
MKKRPMDPIIVFDLGNTLIRFDHNIAAKKIKDLSRVPYDTIYQTFFDSPNTRAFEKGEILSGEFYAGIKELLELELDYDEFVPIWNNIFWEDEVSCGIARRLKSNGYTLFLLSNINKLHFEFIERKFNIINIFDEMVLSYIVGAMKPEKAIFDDAVRRAGGDKTKILYIDDREDLVKEAQALGINSIKFDGCEKLEKELINRGILV